MEKSLLHCFDQREFASGVQNQYKELPERTPTEELSCCPETPVAGYLLLLFLFLGRKVLTGWGVWDEQATAGHTRMQGRWRWLLAPWPHPYARQLQSGCASGGGSGRASWASVCGQEKGAGLNNRWRGTKSLGMGSDLPKSVWQIYQPYTAYSQITSKCSRI